MKKKIYIILAFLVILTLKEVNATPFSAYLPGGKNYLDQANMLVQGNSMITIDDMFVKADTVYTLTLPGFDLLGTGIHLELSGQENYLLGDIDDITDCIVDPDFIICHFTTSSDETELYFELYASQLSLYYDYYGIEAFQLEEGAASTSYEEYINPYIDTTTPEFSGAGAYVKSYQTFELIGAIIANHVVAIDDIDGDLSNQVVIVTDAYTTNEQTVGDYDVVLSVSDSSGNEAFFTLTILVKDEIAPVIIGPDIVDISVDEITIIDGIIANNFSMLDEYDNILNDYVVVDNYTANKRILGEYLVSFSVEDDSLNVASKTFTVNVVDITNPVMVGDNIYNSYLSSPLYLSDVLDSVSFTDNYYDLSGVDPTIVVDNFSLNELVPGTYNINIEMEDGSNNVLSETLTINVIDDVAPIISGPVSYSGSYNNALLVSDFVAMLNVSDNVDALTTDNIYVISDNYSNRVSEVGNYIIVFGIIDINNNEDIHQLDITLFDDVAPVIYVDNYIVTVNLSATFNENDALKLLLNSNELANDNYTIITLIDEYKGNEKTPGAYIYRLSFTNENGEVFEKEFLVKVADTDGLNISKDLLPRNIAIYSSIFGYSVFILLKRRKIVI